MRVKDPVIELLAIALYEHDGHSGYWPPKSGWSMMAWNALAEEDREAYRQIARGERDFGKEIRQG